MVTSTDAFIFDFKLAILTDRLDVQSENSVHKSRFLAIAIVGHSRAVELEMTLQTRAIGHNALDGGIAIRSVHDRMLRRHCSQQT